MDNSILDVAVVGAGHAGLSISFYLKQNGNKHLVFEKSKIGNSWLTQRWDSFKLNTPNKMNLLPGVENNFNDPDGFWSAKEYVAFLESYVENFELPVLKNSKVLSVEKLNGSDHFLLVVSQSGNEKTYQSKNVVVASGCQNKKIVPGIASKISPQIKQMHASEYRSANLLPAGGVLVVGSAQSGVQIAEDLIDAGKQVFISTSKVARIPRRYRGKDIMDWLTLSGFMDHLKDEITDPQMFNMTQPQVSGVGPRGRTVSLQSLAKKGAVILGKMEKAEDDKVNFQPNAAEHVKFGDMFSQQVKNMVDEAINEFKMDAPPPEIDPADIPDEEASCASQETALNLKENNISSVIWATGFNGDFSYLKLPVFDSDGTLIHSNGISGIKGLYFLGFPWLRKRKSGVVLGIDDDAKFISEKLREELN